MVCHQADLVRVIHAKKFEIAIELCMFAESGRGKSQGESVQGAGHTQFDSALHEHPSLLGLATAKL